MGVYSILTQFMGLRALASDDDIVYLSKFVKDNKVIEVYIEHVESYYMPTFTEKLQLKELNNNDEVVELDEELPIVPHTRKRKFLGIPKCRKTLAIEWLSNDQVGQHSGLGGAENASGEDNAASGDENYATADENDNVDGVEDIVDDEHIIDQVDVNMEGFRFTANSDERDTIRPQVNINEDDLEVIDYDEFESELDEDDIGSTRRAALRKLRKKGNADNESGIVNHFFLGQEFGNREEGLLPAIKRLFPSAEHRYCVRHICENMNLTWRGGAYKEMLWNCATATTITQFNRGMEVLKSYNINAYEWLQKIPAEHWSRSHFSGRAHCDLLINNICEVFNRQLLDARNSPIITCLEYVREYLMKRIVIVQNVIEKSVGPLTPSVTKVFNKIKEKATQYNVDWNGGDLYQVKGPYDDQVVVNLKQRICSCRKWEVSGLPCKHAVACINNMNENGLNGGLPENWVHASYRLQTWKEQYTFKINPIAGRDYWEKREWPSILIPPKPHPKIGRPPKKRKKSVVELDELVRGIKLSKKGSTITCSNCKGKGHNKRGCKASAGGRAAGASGSQATSVTATQQEPATSQQGAAATQGAASSVSPFKRTKSTACRLTPTK
ncbi:mutator type transposase [Tanacetum coccineum]